MNWISAHSTHEDFDGAWSEVRAGLQEQLLGDAHFLMVFASGYDAKTWSSIPRYARASFPHARLWGGTTPGSIASTHALVGGPSLVAIAAHLKGHSRVDVVHVSIEEEPLRAAVQAIDWQGVHGVLVLTDPFSVDAPRLLEHVRSAQPQMPVMGAVLSGSDAGTGHAMWSRRGVFREGALLVLLRGGLRLDGVIGQGVVPLGDPFIVMKRRGNLIDSLDSGAPVEVIRSLVRAQGQRDNVRWEELMVGIDEGSDALSMAPPSYVMRGIIGLDPERGSVAVDATVQPYQTVRFHVRDAAAARRELHVLLAAARERNAHQTLGAALVFHSDAGDREASEQPHALFSEIATQCAPAVSAGMFSSEELVALPGERSACHQFSTAIACVYEIDNTF